MILPCKEGTGQVRLDNEQVIANHCVFSETDQHSSNSGFQNPPNLDITSNLRTQAITNHKLQVCKKADC